MRQEILDQWTELKTLIESLEVDVLKNANGNKSAGVRVRKGLRLLKNKSSTLVKSSLQSRDEQHSYWGVTGIDGVERLDGAGGQ